MEWRGGGVVRGWCMTGVAQGTGVANRRGRCGGPRSGVPAISRTVVGSCGGTPNCTARPATCTRASTRDGGRCPSLFARHCRPPTGRTDSGSPSRSTPPWRRRGRYGTRPGFRCVRHPRGLRDLLARRRHRPRPARAATPGRFHPDSGVPPLPGVRPVRHRPGGAPRLRVLRRGSAGTLERGCGMLLAVGAVGVAIG